MRTILFAFSIVAGLALTWLPATAGNQDFQLHNQTGYQIDEVYVSRVNARTWGSDVMGKDTLDHNETVRITFNAPQNACHWDLRVKYDDGDEAVWRNLDLCNINKVTLYWDRRTQNTRAVAE